MPDARSLTSAPSRPPPLDLGLLGVAVVAVSTSAPLIRGADAPSLAIAFWRNALALPVLGALVLASRERRREARELDRRERRLALIAGLFLAAHFAPFDRGVLQACCAAHGVAMPSAEFLCTMRLARREWSP